MALLKKIRSATLIESLVATVLIVVVFIVASLIINNLLFNTFSRNTHAVENRMRELAYQADNKLIALPYKEEFGNWDISLENEESKAAQWLTCRAINRSNKKEVVKSSMYANQ